MICPVRWSDGAVIILDQRELPGRVTYLTCRTVEQVARAIESLAVRGAPLIGITGAYGMALGIRRSRPSTLERDFTAAFDRIRRTRPTAVNLFWALDKMDRAYRTLVRNRRTVDQVKAGLAAEALGIHRDDARTCRMIGKNGACLIPRRARILTHCNTGSLATGGIGTALGVIRTAHRQGKVSMVYADETRPLLQGSRLTAWELLQHHIPATLICDSMAAGLMAGEMVGCVIVGADRIAANGDFANKVGTYGLAVLSRHHGIPFYVAAPVSTFDLSTSNGRGIPIEQRRGEEVTAIGRIATAPATIQAHNPSFDVTPARYVTAFITERGVITPPFRAGFKAKFDAR
jgi:methylthioribose-1-phosphate isomerase